MFIREISPYLTVVNGKWREAKEAARGLGFDDVVALRPVAR
jgi:hypothetical protein